MSHNPASILGIADVVEDTTPQLGGNLDTNSFSIYTEDATSAHPDDIVLLAGSNTAGFQPGGDITITTGDGATASANSGPAGDLTLRGGVGGDDDDFSEIGKDGGSIFIYTGRGGNLSAGGNFNDGGAAGFFEVFLAPGGTSVGANDGNPGRMRLRPDTGNDVGAQLDFLEGNANGFSWIALKAPDSLAATRTWTLPEDDPSAVAGQFLTTDASGVLSFTTGGGDVVDDTTPQLGGNLDTNGNSIITINEAQATNLVLLAGYSTTSANAGGAVNIDSGAGGATGNGGAIGITAGAAGATGYYGGNVTIKAGAADYATSSVYGGDVSIEGGNTGGYYGGDITLKGGAATYNDSAVYGGKVNIIGGEGYGYGGDVVITGGLCTGAYQGGAVRITGGGAGASGTDNGIVDINGGIATANAGAGDCTMRGGGGTNGYNGGIALVAGGQVGAGAGTGGQAELRGGTSTVSGGDGGIALVQGGSGTGAGAGDGGDAQIAAGNSGLTGVGGDVTLVGGSGGGTSGDAGNVIFNAATAAGSGSVGAIVITDQTAPAVTTNKLYSIAGALTWNGTDLTAGGGGVTNPLTANLDVGAYDIISAAGVAATNPGSPIDITAGAGNTTGNGGTLNITGGVGGATGNGGASYIRGGNGGATSGRGGSVYAYGGTGSGSDTGGYVSLYAGTGGTTGKGGAATLTAGDGGATSGDGGDVSLIGGRGDNTAGNVGGDVTLWAGTGGSADNNGAITMTAGNAGIIETVKGYKIINSTGASALVATIPLATAQTYVYEIFATARQDSGTESAVFRIFGGAENTSGTVSLVGSSTVDRSDDGGASVDWDVIVGVSTSNLTISLDNDAETVDWKFKIHLTGL